MTTATPRGLRRRGRRCRLRGRRRRCGLRGRGRSRGLRGRRLRRRDVACGGDVEEPELLLHLEAVLVRPRAHDLAVLDPEDVDEVDRDRLLRRLDGAERALVGSFEHGLDDGVVADGERLRRLELGVGERGGEALVELLRAVLALRHLEVEEAVLLDIVGEEVREVRLLLPSLERREHALRDLDVLLLVCRCRRHDRLGRGRDRRDRTRLRLRAADLRHHGAELTVAVFARDLPFRAHRHDAEAVVADRLLGALHAEELTVMLAVDHPLEDERIVLHPDAREAELHVLERLEPLRHVPFDRGAAVHLVQPRNGDHAVLRVDGGELLRVLTVETLERRPDRRLLQLRHRRLRRRRRLGLRGLGRGRRRRRHDGLLRGDRRRLLSATAESGSERSERNDDVTDPTHGALLESRQGRSTGYRPLVKEQPSAYPDRDRREARPKRARDEPVPSSADASSDGGSPAIHEATETERTHS